MKKAGVKEVLVDTILRYDILLFQEIRDKSGTAIQDLLDLLNTKAVGSTKYNLILSDREGSTASKEQQGWFYKVGVVNPFKVETVTLQPDLDS